MFLKQLEIIGFKSFANKISVEFVPGVTAVVGPNGSGKSNIADAIKWVLGEQSAKTLRGSKMEDIIFSGSDTKRSLNMAEVTLTLENADDQQLTYDFNEISVTRRIFRSGTSEFLINGQSCRLKDIVDLFMDSGLGREAYSIISQGKIDAVLNSKPEEKRKIFEEAAGVLKYKTRKQAAERKLADSQDHLNRVEDIIHELEGQVEPLHEQASIAKDYLEKKEELERFDAALLSYDIEQTHKLFNEQETRVAQLDQTVEDMSVKLSQKEHEFGSEKQKLNDVQLTMDKLQMELVSAAETLEKLEGQKNVLNERQKYAKENAEDLKDRIERLEKKYGAGQETLSTEKKNLAKEEKKAQALKSSLKEKEERLHFLNEDLDTVLDRLKSEYFDLLNKQTSVRNETSYLNDRLNQLVFKRDHLTSQAADYDNQTKSIQERKAQSSAQLLSAKQKLEQIQTELTQTQKDKEKTTARYDKIRTALQNVNHYIEQAQSKKQMLEAMSEDYAGFFQGVKLVLKAKNRPLTGIHGAVAELLQVEKKYELAIETALGGSLQNIAVESEAEARHAITFLKNKKGGRATFLPLNVIKSRVMSSTDRDRIKNHAGFIGLGCEIITCQPVYKRLADHLLGHIIIASDLKQANDLSRAMSFRYRIVTLDGDVVNPGGAMTGGSQNQKSTSLIGRQRDIDQLEIQLQEMKEKQANMSLEYKSMQQKMVDHDMAIQEQTIANRETSNEAKELEQADRELAFEYKTLSDRFGMVQRERDDFQTEHSEAKSKIEKLKTEEKAFETKKSTLEKQIDSLGVEKRDQQSSKEKLQDSLTELKVEAASQSERLMSQREKTKRLTEELSVIKHDLDEAKHAVQDFTHHLNHHVSDRETIEETIVEKRKTKEDLAVNIQQLQEQKKLLKSHLDSQEEALKRLQNQFKGFSEERQEQKIRLNRLDIKLENLLETLRLEYEMSFEHARENYPLMIEAEQARQKVKLLKRSIDELGTVNIGSIEEYERVSERFHFLQTQRDDLLQAKATLLDVMGEMDQEVIKRFDDMYNKVKEQFQEIFKALFGGGKADLALTDEEDLLNSGVDILAQPPGKKLQNLSLLSGGERALTAIALLFAILKVRPVPFCVLDEVEAALDDANVDRYASYLKLFSKETQFIVVTHRKGTMELADVLYGVTMQESGVSKLVSVRLEDTRELIET